MKNIFYVSLLFLMSNPTFGGIDIRAPEIAENGSVIPVTLKFTPPLSNTESTQIKINGVTAMQATLRGNSAIKSFATRLKSTKPGNVTIQALRKKNGRTIASKDFHLRVNEAYSLHKTNKTQIASNGRVKEKVKGRKYKALFPNEMAANSYINQINLALNNSMLIISPTPLLSKNPYFGIAIQQPIKYSKMQYHISKSPYTALGNITQLEPVVSYSSGYKPDTASRSSTSNGGGIIDAFAKTLIDSGIVSRPDKSIAEKYREGIAEVAARKGVASINYSTGEYICNNAFKAKSGFCKKSSYSFNEYSCRDHVN